MEKEGFFMIIILLIIAIGGMIRISLENKYNELLREKIYQIQIVTPDGKIYPIDDYSYYHLSEKEKNER